MALCFFFIGPAPYLSLEPTPGLIQGSVAISGLVSNYDCKKSDEFLMNKEI